MPVTRSVSRQAGEEVSGPQPGANAAEASTSSAAEVRLQPGVTADRTSAPAVAEDAAASSAESRTTVTTESSGTVTTKSSATTEPTVRAEPAAKKTPTRPPSRAGSSRNKELARAKLELLEKEVKLAAARVAVLEIDDDSDVDFDGETLRGQRTHHWVQNNPHTEFLPEKEEPKKETEKKITAPDSVNYNELATAITLAARAIQPVHLPRQAELPTFNGAPSDWLLFKTAYEETAVLYSEAENLSRLRRCLRGAAKDAAYCLFVGSPSTGEVMGLECNIDGCIYKHHQLLHSPTTTTARTEEKQEDRNFTVASAREIDNTKALLKILPVQLKGPRGVCDAYALLDDGSTCSLIDAAVAEKIGADGPVEPFYIEGVAGTKIDAEKSKRVEFGIRGIHSKLHSITARTMSNLRLSPQGVPRRIMESCKHLRDIEDLLQYEEGSPTVLLGQDNWHLLTSNELRRGDSKQPVASHTPLGWVLHGLRELGGAQRHRVHHIHSHEEEEPMEQLMKQHFALESLGVEARRSFTDAERRAMQILEAKTKRIPTGGFETGLLWKTDAVHPPDNFKSALTRLEHIERKLDRDDNMKNRYKQQIANLVDNGFAEAAPTEKSTKLWYLPHFAVINPQKPDKLRIVHDAAAKTRGVSLNDMLLSGPDLLQSLPGVLMKFRQRPIAVTADIKDMFLRVTIREEDRDMQRFLWRDDRREGPPDEYRMKSVIFGATSSPCTAIYVKNTNAEEHRAEYPEAAAAIVDNHYMDDYLASFDNEEEAIRVSRAVTHVHSRASFHLQKWTSNSKHVLEQLSPGPRSETVYLNKEKILGMVWQPHTDTLSFNINKYKIPEDILDGSKTPTKREALRTVMSLFDPLGIATPVTIQAKRILQDTWRSGIEWDATLQPSEAETWTKWVHSISELSLLAVPRCYSRMSQAHDIQLHTFVDASSSAYAAAVYWRVEDEHGQVHVSLIAGKGKVAPLKLVSIPRLELQAAVLGSRLVRTAIEQHDVQPKKCYYWTDSRTVLAWIRNGPRVYKPYVAHRVAELAENTKTKQWRWVPTSVNVADDATRDAPASFTSEHRWFQGPAFLRLPEEDWPREDTVSQPVDTGEERVTVLREGTRLAIALSDITRYSSWLRVIRVTARVLQFIDKLRARQRCTALWKRTEKKADVDPTWTRTRKQQPSHQAAPVSAGKTFLLEARHLHRAQLLWVRAVQEDSYEEELAAIKDGKAVPSGSRLAQLSLVVDSDGVLRLRSRIAAAIDITTTQREPAVVDGNHRWTRLYIAWVHRQLHHGGYEITANEVRQHYFVLRLRHSVRTEVKSCQICRLRRAKPAQPSTGNHPRSRLAHHQRPFSFTGLDYFGPLTVTVGRSHQKRYGVLFTCLTTRAVHLEVAGSLSTDSAIMALRRFISRRGCPTELWSDQGTNLRGADVELKKAAREAMENEASIRFITWKFIPPSAPFMGGAWERLVRSVKTALDVTLHERAPREEVLHTLLVEAEFTINSRPLTHLSVEAEDAEALTPNHFLLGGPARVPLPGAFTESDATGAKQWRVSQRLADAFWSRWVREYLPELQHRREPRARGHIQLGDLVLIADGTLPRNAWPRGQVEAVFPGPDGEVRAVDVRTTRGLLRRPTKKLVILPTKSP